MFRDLHEAKSAFPTFFRLFSDFGKEQLNTKTGCEREELAPQRPRLDVSRLPLTSVGKVLVAWTQTGQSQIRGVRGGHHALLGNVVEGRSVQISAGASDLGRSHNRDGR